MDTSTLFTNVRILDGTGAMPYAGSVLVQGNRIRTVGGENAFEITDGIGGKTDIGGDSSLLDIGFTARSGLLLIYGAVTRQDGGALQNFTGVQFGAKYTW